jgi:hypothetical protein
MYMSRLLQASLRKKIFDSYFGDASRYAPNDSCAALLVYAALPVTTSVILEDGKITFNTDKAPYWDYADVDLRRAMITNPHTLTLVESELAVAQAKLLKANSQNAPFFAPSRAPVFADMVVGDAAGSIVLTSLLLFEARMVSGATATGVRIASLKASGQAVDIQSELDKLQQVITGDYNQKLAGLYGDVDIRSVLLEATKVFQSPVM